MQTPSTKLKPFMAYIENAQYTKLRKLSNKAKIPMSQLIREAIDIRVSDNQYVSGFNNGLEHAMKLIAQNQASQMRFPSGKSFAELLNEELETARMVE